MEPTVFKFIWRYSKKEQMLLLVATLISFPVLYFSLDLPKTIINEAINSSSRDFVEFPREILGVEFTQLEYLFALCGIFLCLVLINGGFKFWINVYRGRMGERMLRRLRYTLYNRVLRFPLAQFKKISQGEIISMITAEVEPLGGYIGAAISLPAFQGGTLLTILVFIMIQDPFLGVAAIALYPVQMYLIPKLQRRVNELGKQRVRTVRKLSEKIGETVSGIQEVHAHDTSAFELSTATRWLGQIFKIRYDIYQRKFFIKFLNNFIAQVTPFFFYSIGGYLVIEGDLSFGALVAVLAAYKDLSPPWKELLAFYQIAADARIKYEQLIEQFRPSGMLPEELQASPPETAPEVDGHFESTNVVIEDDTGLKSLDGTSALIPLSGSTAVLGSSESGRDDLARLIVRLIGPSKGTVRLGGQDPGKIHEATYGRRTAYVDANSYVFNGTIRENLLYGLKHRPVTDPDYDDEGVSQWRDFVQEAELSGNSLHDINAAWEDFGGLGLAGETAISEHLSSVLKMADLEYDVRDLGLQASLDPERHPEIADKVLDGRREFLGRLSDPKISKLVKPFDAEKFNDNMTVAENILMGTPVGPTFDFETLGTNSYVLSVLERVGIVDAFLEGGIKVAETMVEIFQDLPPGHEFFERYSFIRADELAEFQRILRQIKSDGVDAINEEDRERILGLPFLLIPERHRLGVISDEKREKILEARRVFAKDLPDEHAGAIAFYDIDAYNAAASVQDNILFGKVAHGRANARAEVGRIVDEVIGKLDLHGPLIELGLNTSVGVAGGRLSTSQRQKVCFARALVKSPQIGVFNDPLNALDPASQENLLDRALAKFADGGLVWVLNRPELSRRFDNVVIMDGGRVVEQGAVADLDKDGSELRRRLDG